MVHFFAFFAANFLARLKNLAHMISRILFAVSEFTDN